MVGGTRLGPLERVRLELGSLEECWRVRAGCVMDDDVSVPEVLDDGKRRCWKKETGFCRPLGPSG